MSTPISVRFPDEVARRLRRSGAGTGEATSGLVVRLVDEGIRMAEHPGVVFRDGPTGRRAGLAAGPDVWEIVVVLRDYSERRAAEAARRAAKRHGPAEPQSGSLSPKRRSAPRRATTRRSRTRSTTVSK